MTHKPMDTHDKLGTHTADQMEDSTCRRMYTFKHHASRVKPVSLKYNEIYHAGQGFRYRSYPQPPFMYDHWVWRMDNAGSRVMYPLISRIVNAVDQAPEMWAHRLSEGYRILREQTERIK